jgi:hypothetical protein
VNNELESMKKEAGWPNFKVLFQHLRGRSEENHKNLSQDSRSRGQHSKLGPPKYEAGVVVHVVTTRV